MDSIKNFILDNIRYIISGILLILIIVILVQCTGKEKKEDTQENTCLLYTSLHFLLRLTILRFVMFQERFLRLSDRRYFR